jgi:hypothetical protein
VAATPRHGEASYKPMSLNATNKSESYLRLLRHVTEIICQPLNPTHMESYYLALLLSQTVPQLKGASSTTSLTAEHLCC